MRFSGSSALISFVELLVFPMPSAVINSASALCVELHGVIGRHARATARLHKNAAVEIKSTAAIRG
jgi:hypothetical protein